MLQWVSRFCISVLISITGSRFDIVSETTPSDCVWLCQKPIETNIKTLHFDKRAAQISMAWALNKEATETLTPL